MASIEARSSNIENIVLGSLNAKWSARGDRILRYCIDFRHMKLNLHKELSAPEIFILQRKVDALMASWDEKFADYQRRSAVLAGQDEADRLTASAQTELATLGRILEHTLIVNDAVDWDSLKDHSLYPMPTKFPEPRPALKQEPKPEYVEPHISFFDRLLGKKAQKMQAAEDAFSNETSNWMRRDTERQTAFQTQLLGWEERQTQFWAEQKRAETAFLAEQAERNSKVDELKAALEAGSADAVIEHATLVLDASDYGGLFEKSFVIQYHESDQLLLVAYDLPPPDALPSVKSVKFAKATGELKESHITEREVKANFELVAYQICLRTIHELFEADEFSNVSNILFNGYVNFIDRRTGQEARSCLLSIVVARSVFDAIDLGRVGTARIDALWMATMWGQG
jgi:restriction system protein